MSITWRDKIFQMAKTQTGFMSHGTDHNGVIIFRWRMYYDDEVHEDFNVPFGVIEHFETFKALCRQFDTPEDAKEWYGKKLEIAVRDAWHKHKRNLRQ